MIRLTSLLIGLFAVIVATPTTFIAQRLWLDPAEITKPLGATWPTYSGDYTGKRFSALNEVNTSNIRSLTLAWTARVTAGPNGGARGGGAPTIIGGEGPDAALGGGANIKGSIVQVNDVLYVTAPDNVWAVDARDGRTIWHYFWKTRGGIHIGNRGVGIYGDWLFFETPDNYLVSLDARTGKERWHTVIAPFEHQYFSTPAPVIVRDHVIVGTGNDLDSPGFLQSFDPRDGKLRWKFYTVPMKPGDPGADSWGSLDAARYGGAQAWMPGAYDPETNLYYFGTGNPTPAFMTGPRGPGDHLFTNSLMAVNVDTGKMAWAYQTSPRDTHDWDSAQTPVLYDGEFNGRPRKLIMTAARNGYFFVLDRVTGEHLLTSTFADVVNWSTGLNAKGQPVPDPAKDPSVGGVLVSMSTGGAVNWQPPSFSPADRAVLRASRRELHDVLSHRNGSARCHGSRWLRADAARHEQQLPGRNRLPHRKNRMAAHLPADQRLGRQRRAERLPAVSSSPATSAATSSPTTRRMAASSGTRASATFPMRRRRT